MCINSFVSIFEQGWKNVMQLELEAMFIDLQDG